LTGICRPLWREKGKKRAKNRAEDQPTREKACRPNHMQAESLVSVAAFAYAGLMQATAVVGGKVVRFKLSPALARAHGRNRGRAMNESEAVAFVEAKRRSRALRRAKPYLASRP
jgi:hypothetical protein